MPLGLRRLLPTASQPYPELIRLVNVQERSRQRSMIPSGPLRILLLGLSLMSMVHLVAAPQPPGTFELNGTEVDIVDGLVQTDCPTHVISEAVRNRETICLSEESALSEDRFMELADAQVGAISKALQQDREEINSRQGWKLGCGWITGAPVWSDEQLGFRPQAADYDHLPPSERLMARLRATPGNPNLLLEYVPDFWCTPGTPAPDIFLTKTVQITPPEPSRVYADCNPLLQEHERYGRIQHGGPKPTFSCIRTEKHLQQTAFDLVQQLEQQGLEITEESDLRVVSFRDGCARISVAQFIDLSKTPWRAPDIAFEVFHNRFCTLEEYERSLE